MPQTSHPGGHPSGYVPQNNGMIQMVPTGNLVELGPKNGLRKKFEDHPGSSGSSTSTLTGQRGPIPLTIKQLEV
jgi:hypothetical protein